MMRVIDGTGVSGSAPIGSSPKPGEHAQSGQYKQITEIESRFSSQSALLPFSLPMRVYMGTNTVDSALRQQPPGRLGILCHVECIIQMLRQEESHHLIAHQPKDATELCNAHRAILRASFFYYTPMNCFVLKKSLVNAS